MHNPRELKVFVMANDLAVAVYRMTASFPAEERFGLSQQLRRAAVSVGSNIVEGCSRESQADFRRFVEIATGSAMEVEFQVQLSARLGFGEAQSRARVLEQSSALARALIVFSKTLRADS